MREPPFLYLTTTGRRTGLPRRIEICFPILDARLKERVIAEGLKPYLADRCDAWQMTPDGRYERQASRDGEAAQNILLSALT